MEREFKDSGIEWIGRIPKEWKTERIKALFSERNERDCQGRTLLSVSQYFGIRPKSETDLADSHIAESYDDYKEVHKGDFVMNIMLAWNGSYAVSDYDGIVSPAYCVFKFRKDCCKKFFHYLLRTDGYPVAFKTMSRGVIDSRLRLYPEQFYTFPVIFPPSEEQQRIADYLDKKCGEIDELIALQGQMIAQLTDYKQSVITEAVTKGLNPDAELVPSGIDWIGDVPKGWKVCRFKSIAAVKANLVSPDLYLDYPQVAPDNIEKGSGKLLSWKKVKEAGIISDNHLFFKGQIVYSKIRPMLNKVIIAPFDGLCSADMYPIETKLVSKYLLYYMLSSLFTQQVQRYVNDRVKMPKINKEEIANILTIIPSESEQHAIATYLDTKCSEIDSLIAIKQQKIETLKDYKKSVIYEAVTGKMTIEGARSDLQSDRCEYEDL